MTLMGIALHINQLSISKRSQLQSVILDVAKMKGCSHQMLFIRGKISQSKKLMNPKSRFRGHTYTMSFGSGEGVR